VTSEDFERLLRPMKHAAAALHDAKIDFVLAGGIAAWARGGPGSDHDVDFCIRPGDADTALAVLADAGFRTERPPEAWLYKAYLDDQLVDLIFEPAGLAVDDELFERADEMDVKAVSMRVMRPTDILITKLMAMNDHYLDFEGSLLIARTLREQIEWDRLRRYTAVSPFACAFLTLTDGLGISTDAAA
jgi:nucleotidyltransferase DUF2204